jgi:hypothetical protein
MRVTEHVVLAQEVEHRAQFLAALSRGSTRIFARMTWQPAALSAVSWM